MAGVSDRRSPPYRLALSGARKHQENRPRYPRTGLHQSGAELRHDVHAALHVLSRHAAGTDRPLPARSEEHSSELLSLMRISYAVFFLYTHSFFFFSLSF